MEPTLSIDGPITGPEPSDDDLFASSADDAADQSEARGPGDGDARVMAWARAM